MNTTWTAGWALMLWCVMGAAIAMGQANTAPPPVAFTGKTIQPADAPATWAKGLLDSGQAFDISHFVMPAQGIADDKLAALKQSMTQMRALFPEKATFAWVDGKSFDNIGSSPIIVPMAGETVEHPSTFRLPEAQPHQLYMIFRADNAQGVPCFVHLLVWPADKEWRIADIRIKTVKVGRWDDPAAVAAARDEYKADRSFNALALYSIAGAINGNIPYRLSGRAHALDAEIAPLVKTLGLPAKPMESIELDGITYDIRGLAPVQFNNDVYLAISIAVNELADNDTMKARHPRIAKALLAKHPQLQQFFEGIAVASAHPQSGKGYRSAHTMKELLGTDAAPAPADKTTP